MYKIISTNCNINFKVFLGNWLCHHRFIPGVLFRIDTAEFLGSSHLVIIRTLNCMQEILIIKQHLFCNHYYLWFIPFCSLWYSCIPCGKFWDGTFVQTTTASFHILYSSYFILISYTAGTVIQWSINHNLYLVFLHFPFTYQSFHEISINELSDKFAICLVTD